MERGIIDLRKQVKVDAEVTVDNSDIIDTLNDIDEFDPTREVLRCLNQLIDEQKKTNKLLTNILSYE